MWKKLLQVCLLGVALTACHVEKTETQSAPPTPEERVLRVATHAKYAPFETIENKELVGFDMDLIKAMGEAG
ncbi:MAG: transporter substrate-binding domain-containing protein, partial [Neisseriaceae bacterium]|nr:transporter substrate-binding domain-containing protein [Neisseriaceae bacterium]